jgi:hypothetical protein
MGGLKGASGESARRQPRARTTGSAQPTGSTEPRPFSRLLASLPPTTGRWSCWPGSSMNADATTPRQAPGTSKPGCSAWRCVVEVAAAFGLPLPPLAAVAVAAVAGAFDLGGANLRLAPTSSASISATDRFSPSGSQLRWRSRPVTITRPPLARESARYPAWPRQAMGRAEARCRSFGSSDSSARPPNRTGASPRIWLVCSWLLLWGGAAFLICLLIVHVHSEAEQYLGPSVAYPTATLSVRLT